MDTRKKKPIWAKRLDAIAASDPEFPNMRFEDWFNQGIECFRWNLPRPLVRQAFQALERDTRRHWGRPVEAWQLRAFVYGLRGGCDDREICRAPGFVWALPDDPSWQLIVFVYRDGHSMLDWVHPVSRRFWSEDNDPIELPAHQGELHGEEWFRRMGFDVMVEWESGQNVAVARGAKRGHLRAVEQGTWRG